MSNPNERTLELDPAETHAQENLELQQAIERAEHAEAEVARLKAPPAATSPAGDKQPPSPSTVEAMASGHVPTPSHAPQKGEPAGGVDALRNDAMMTHLLDSLEAGKDIGHYGRLVFCMVARHFLTHDELLHWLTRDSDFSEEQAAQMLQQVDAHDYTPPKRDRILEWQSQQEFPILPDVDDLNCGNVYRSLKFPDAIYQHIGQYAQHAS